MKLYTDEQMADVKGKILYLLSMENRGIVASIILKKLETTVISPTRINAGLLALAEEGKIKLSARRRQGPDGGRERIWYMTADCPATNYTRQKQIHRPQQFKHCPRCRKDRFENLEGGGARCGDCGLEQKGLFS